MGHRGLLIAAALLCALATPAAAQTISGVLKDAESGRTIAIGLVMMYTEQGDSVTATMTTVDGAFTVSSPEPGDFVLVASAMGYARTPVGVFELGDGGSMTIEYSLEPEPLPIEALVVDLDRPLLEHHLVRNGFVDRLQRGLGLFLTPYEIERHSALSTERLLSGLPGVRVGPTYSGIQGNPGAGDPSAPVPDGLVILTPRGDLGEAVQIATPTGWCVPTLYLDGLRVPYLPDMGITLNSLVDRSSIEAIEVYRRGIEIPVEYSPGTEDNCGVIVAWSKLGLAAGQGPSGSTIAYRGPVDTRLPNVGRTGAAPLPGERIRLQIESAAASTAGWSAPWEGSLTGLANGDLVAEDLRTGRNYSVPVESVLALQVQRPKGDADKYLRGGIAGVGIALFTRLGLGLLCGWSHCGEGVENHWVPAVAAGAVVGTMVYRRGPGNRWESVPVPLEPGR